MPDLERIMFVEDDEDVFPLIELSLTRVGGFRTHGFMKGEDAVAQAQGLDPQLILLDVMMPGMDGPQTMQALRGLEGFDRKPIVFLTAKVHENDIARLLRLGAADVLPKPFVPNALCDDIRSIWTRHLASQRLTPDHPGGPWPDTWSGHRLH